MSTPLNLPIIPDEYFLESTRKMQSSIFMGDVPPTSKALVIYDESFAADQLERLMRTTQVERLKTYVAESMRRGLMHYVGQPFDPDPFIASTIAQMNAIPFTRTEKP